MKIIIFLFISISGVLLSCKKDVSRILPKADFSVDSSSVFINDSIQFINLSKGVDQKDSSLNFQWYFQGGKPEYSILIAPKVVYMTPGSYSVKLILNNKYGQDSIIKTDFINVEGILVGKLNGLNIVHKVYSPPITDINLGTIDIDGDGLNDIQFSQFVNPSEHFYEKEIYVVSLNNTQISVSEQDTTWAKRHIEGDIISHQLIWKASRTNFAEFCLSGTNCGAFDNYSNGYICFKINNQNKIYGWINLRVYANSMTSYFEIDDYAYTTINKRKK